MNRKYRIIRILYTNHTTVYKIQRECRFLHKYIFWGPRIWKTFLTGYKCGSEYSTWSFLKGNSYNSTEGARIELDRILNKYRKIKNTDIIFETQNN